MARHRRQRPAPWFARLIRARHIREGVSAAPRRRRRGMAAEPGCGRSRAIGIGREDAPRRRPQRRSAGPQRALPVRQRPQVQGVLRRQRRRGHHHPAAGDSLARRVVGHAVAGRRRPGPRAVDRGRRPAPRRRAVRAYVARPADRGYGREPAPPSTRRDGRAPLSTRRKPVCGGPARRRDFGLYPGDPARSAQCRGSPGVRSRLAARWQRRASS
jgi:hypothetical protein